MLLLSGEITGGFASRLITVDNHYKWAEFGAGALIIDFEISVSGLIFVFLVL
jgi:hypothetical protein